MTRRVLAYTLLTLAAVALFHLAWVILDEKVTYLVLQAFVATGATVFSVVYHVTARWWESVMGRNIMLLVGSIAAILDLGLLFNILGRPEWMRELFAFLYFAIGWAIWHRLTILIDAQYHSPEHPGAGTPGKR